MLRFFGLSSCGIGCGILVIQSNLRIAYWNFRLGDKVSRQFLLFIHACIIPLSFARTACDDQRRSRDHSKQVCDQLSGASVGSMAGGGMLLGPIGGLLGLVTGIPASHNCEIARNKDNELQVCLRDTIERERRALDEARRLALDEDNRRAQEAARVEKEQQRTREREARIEKENLELVLMRELRGLVNRRQTQMANERNVLDENVDSIIGLLDRAGHDLDDPETRARIEAYIQYEEEKLRKFTEALNAEFERQAASIFERAAQAGITLEMQQ